MDETKRRIVTWNGATRVGFRETAGSLPPLSATQMATLSPDPVTQKKMVHYLRGGNIVNMPLAPVNGFVDRGHRHRPVPQPLRQGAGVSALRPRETVRRRRLAR